MFPAFLACMYTFSSVRLVDSGQICTDAVYGDHGVKDSIMWEVSFWTFVCLQHAVVQCVLSSPTDVLYVAGTSFTVTVLLLAFCVIAVNSSADSPSRRFEGPVFILISLTYLVIVSETKIVLGRQFTFMMWFTHIALNCMLVMGHLWDNPVTCQTILNCRWTYVIASCWFNVCLYVAY
jgi:membrane-associated HD superfamily phosphohydrolase